MIPQMTDAAPRTEETTALVTPRTRKRITKGVVIAHLIAIFSPFIAVMIEEMLEPPKPDVMTVDLKMIPTKIAAITNVPGGNPPPGNPGPPAPPEPTPNIPVPIVKEPSVKEPVIDLPKPPPDEPRVVSDINKIMKKIKKQQEERENAQKTAEAQKKEQAKNFKPASAADIDQVKRLGPPGSGGSGKGAGTGPPATGPIGPGGKGTGEFTATYEDYLGTYLKRFWDTPERRLLNGRKPEVTVQVSIASDGRIVGHRIIRPSNIELMDDSVERIFTALRQVMAPPDGKPREIALIFELSEEDK